MRTASCRARTQIPCHMSNLRPYPLSNHEEFYIAWEEFKYTIKLNLITSHLCHYLHRNISTKKPLM
jgi:hypothetical protein